MTATYVGMRDSHWNKRDTERRAVELGYDESEEKAFERVVSLMKIKGWNIETGVEGWGICMVECKEEAEDFMRDWKQSKRCIANCIKYGF